MKIHEPARPSRPHVVTFRMSEPEYEALAARAEKLGVSLSELVRISVVPPRPNRLSTSTNGTDVTLFLDCRPE